MRKGQVGPFLQSRRPTRRTSPSAQPSSAQPTVEFALRLARGARRTMALDTSLSGRFARSRERWRGCSVARCLPLLRKKEGQTHAMFAEQANMGSEGFCSSAGGNTLPLVHWRESVARFRWRSRVVSVVAEVDSWMFGAEKRALPLQPIWKRSGTGASALGRACESTNGRA